MSTGSAIYVGEVVHQRHRPKRHRLRYRVFSILIDLDELPALDGLKYFGWDRRALFAFKSADHGHGEGLREWATAQLQDAGLPAPAKIRLLCYPRILGYVFNPLSVWFCDDDSGKAIATIYEVHNTFGERHTYVLPVGAEQAADKEFYVSPFIGLDCRYQFKIVPPEERVRIAINETEAGEPLLYAAFSGTRREFTDANLLRLFFSHPLMTLKVTAGIHWEALRLLLKGSRVHGHVPKDKIHAARSQRREADHVSEPVPLSRD